MKIAVLGLGKIGHGIAALLASRGFEIVGFTRDEKKAEDVNRYGITVTGAVEGNFKIQASTEIKTVVESASYLVVTTTSKGHKPMAQLLRGKLEMGQRIIIITGNWGAYEFYTVLKEELKEKRVIVGETSGNLAAVPELKSPASIFLKPVKKRMSFAAIPAKAAPQVVSELKTAFPEFYPVENILATSMNSTNPPVHVPVCLFNITRLAGGEEASFYGQGLPPVLEEFLMAADRERCAVIEAMGGKPESILSMLNGAWNSNYGSIRELGMENASLKSVKLPKTPYHRFLLEDVPYGFMPVSALGKRCGVKTPRIDLMIEAYRLLLGERAELSGPDFSMDFSEVL